MASNPLHASLKKIDSGDVTVQAPEWANDDRRVLWVRAAAATVLIAFVIWIVLNVDTRLPGEGRSGQIESTLVDRAVAASKKAANAEAAVFAARRELKESRASFDATRDDSTATPVSLEKRKSRRAEDKSELLAKRGDFERRTALHVNALEDVAALRSNSELNLVRAVGVGGLALIALASAGAILAPRRSQLLRVGRHEAQSGRRDPGASPPAGGAGTGDEGIEVAADPATESPDPADSSLAKSEPALTQGLVASAALIAGIFGIQELRGTSAFLLNIAIPLVPIVGALFTRGRVAARPNISAAERVRLFGTA